MPQGHVPRVGKWLPEDHALLEKWLRNLVDRVDARSKRCKGSIPLDPVIEEFKDLIEQDAAIFMLFHQMFHQIPNKPPYDKDPTGKPQVRDYMHMLECFNEILTTAPEYQKDTGLVGFPINAIIDWPMGTPSGFAAFLNEKVNEKVCKMLNKWGEYLRSEESRYVLSTDDESGWFGVQAMSEPLMQDFDTTYICDPGAEYHGYKSWDDFFTREFQANARPIECEDDDRFVVNACESGPYDIQRYIKERDLFWIKGQPYSVSHMLANDPDYYAQFIGGTVYQAFLSALCYHRWHSPVNGEVVKVYRIPGTYYSEARVVGFDEAAPNESQGYITEVATRAVIFIKADNPDIGLMCFMAVGMAEVSSCEINKTIEDGLKTGPVRVKKGQELGMFHFGGSTHCLLFRKGVDVIFHLSEDPGLDASVVPINTVIAINLG
ncbi:Phophatidylserine decarboxylase-domain-containing protein [Trichophaea hybrida]|nr:Phophatidylserine decarboxylase-domain-containing protein [Trichophaea hybrida]